MALKFHARADGTAFVILNGAEENLEYEGSEHNVASRLQADLQFESRVTAEWAAKPALRPAFGCMSYAKAGSPEYEQGLKRYLSAQRSWDQKYKNTSNAGSSDARVETGGEDSDPSEVTLATRFAAESGLRRSFGVNTSDKRSPEYEQGLKRYLSAQARIASREVAQQSAEK